MRACSMRVLLFVLVVTAAFASAAEEADNAPFYEGTKCNVITKSSQLEALLKEGEPLFIEFYAPWCGHCKKAKPEVIELCGKAQGYRVVTVDAVATQNSRIAREFNVNSYPTFVFMRNGAGSVQEPFRGDMTADGMDKWVQRRLSAPALSDAASITDVFPADEASPPTVVAVYAPSSWDKVKPEIIKLATLGRDDFRTSIITDAALAASLGLSADGMMGVYHLNSHQVARGDFPLTATYDLNSSKGVKGLQKWLTVNKLPLLGMINSKNHQSFYESGLPLLWIFTQANEEADVPEGPESLGTIEHMRPELNALATKWRGKMICVHVPADQGAAGHSRTLGLTGNKFPAATLVTYTDKQTNYAVDEETEFTAAKVAEHIELFFAKKLKPTLKSEKELPEHMADPVKIVVGTTFKALVDSSKEDVFIEFYAPWCGHCQKLAPIYDDLAEQLLPIAADVRIAKMDATANDFDKDKYAVSSYPTLFYVPSGKSPVLYEGKHTVDAMEEFIRSKAKTRLAKRTQSSLPEEPAATIPAPEATASVAATEPETPKSATPSATTVPTNAPKSAEKIIRGTATAEDVAAIIAWMEGVKERRAAEDKFFERVRRLLAQKSNKRDEL